MIRPATLQDYNAVLRLLTPEMERYPLRPDKERIHKALTEVLGNSKHFAYVCEKDGGIRGVILGITSENLWAQRMNNNVVAWVCKAAGEGAQLLRAYRDWVLSRRGIKVAGFAPDIDVDPRAWTLAERIGFERRGGALLLFN